jgi:hypothetical protein
MQKFREKVQVVKPAAYPDMAWLAVTEMPSGPLLADAVSKLGTHMQGTKKT